MFVLCTNEIRIVVPLLFSIEKFPSRSSLNPAIKLIPNEPGFLLLKLEGIPIPLSEMTSE
jgi:hypothetical protein